MDEHVEQLYQKYAQRWNGDPFYMAGTEGTGKYLVVVVTPYGRVGYRDLERCNEDDIESYRIRVEPTSEEDAELMAPNFSFAWKQYGQDGQPRFSIVAIGEGELERAMSSAFIALGPTDDYEINGGMVLVNPEASERMRELMNNPADYYVNYDLPESYYGDMNDNPYYQDQCEEDDRVENDVDEDDPLNLGLYPGRF